MTMAPLQDLRLALQDASARHATDPSTAAAQAWAAARAAYQSALAAEPTLWPDTTPAVLTPVRLEVRYLAPTADEPAPQLAIRVIPDDIAHYTFAPELTPDEHAAGHLYWDSHNADPAAAWARILDQLGIARAAWAVEVTADDSTLKDPGTRTSTAAATSLLLPDKFIFRGWRDRRLVFEVPGNPVRADLTLGPHLTTLGETDPKKLPADPTDRLPWTGPSRWMVQLDGPDGAVEVGMAVKVPLPGPDLALDAITVLGVSGSSAADGADRLARTLQGHLYTDGLDYPPAGSPTNNTDATRSQWTSQPTVRTPEEVKAAITRAQPGPAQPGVALADAFGLPSDVQRAVPGRRDLLATPGGTDDNGDDDLARRAHQLMADYITLTQPIPDHPTGWLTTDARRIHFTTHVRAGGPLPVLRVGRQPYGILPVTSLPGWAAGADPDCPDDVVADILLRRTQLDAWLGASPYLSADPDQDQDPVLLGLLQRQPAPVAVRAFTTFETFEMSPPFDPTGSATPDPAQAQPPPLTAMATWAAGTPQNAQAHGFLTLATDLDPNCHLHGLYWAIQAYAALHWRGAWVVGGAATMTPAQWAALNADITAATKPLQALDNDAPADRDRHLAAAAAALTCRLDAWSTSVATARLRAQRAAAPTGVHVGMYGWLVDIAPLAQEQRTAESGWVLTPSVQHAVTASVLFAAAQAHDSAAFDIDLSSARVRRARSMLAELRNGATLEELLGYQLERALHDNQFDTAVRALRNNYPLPLAATSTPGTPDTSRAARLVTDGDAVRQADPRTTVIDLIVSALPADGDPTPDLRATAIAAILHELDDTVDAIGDVLMAEAVHHLVGGSPLRAGLAADTIGKAAAPPERLDAISTPTSAVTVTHCLALDVATPPPGSGPWPATPGGRATLDPAAEAIAAWALGDPNDWRITYTGHAGDPTPTTALTPADLAVSAIDFGVELTDPADTSALAARTRTHLGAPAKSGTVTVVRTDGLGGPDAAPTLTGALRAVLSRCRALPDPAAVLDPAAGVTSTADLGPIVDRITGWWNDVHTELGSWNPGADTPTQTEVLARLATLGLDGARFDAATAAGTALAAHWLPTRSLLSTAAPADATAAAATTWLDTVAAAVRPAAGDWFTPAVNPKPAGADDPALPGAAPAEGADDAAAGDWIRQHAPVCPGVAALADLLALAGACGAGHPPAWALRQNVTDPTATGWVATSHPGTRSATALTALRIDGADPASPRAHLVVDQWSEAVPTAAPAGGDPQQQAALALRFDSPDSRAPQAVLVVTAPDPGRNWCAEDLHVAVEETLWWAMVRPLDTDDLPEQKAHY
jgi:hypothetical protein